MVQILTANRPDTRYGPPRHRRSSATLNHRFDQPINVAVTLAVNLQYCLPWPSIRLNCLLRIRQWQASQRLARRLQNACPQGPEPPEVMSLSVRLSANTPYRHWPQVASRHRRRQTHLEQGLNEVYRHGNG